MAISVTPVAHFMDGFPDYFEDFEEFIKIAKAVDRTIWSLEVSGAEIVEERWMLYNVISYERWANLLDSALESLNERKIVPILLFPCDVVTLNEVQYYLGAWIYSDEYKVEYDSENYAVKIKTLKSVPVSSIKKKLIRNFIPMNMEVEYEVVEEL